jgi:hypothetical protein
MLFRKVLLTKNGKKIRNIKITETKWYKIFAKN